MTSPVARVAEVAPEAAAGGRLERLEGWAGAMHATCWVHRPSTVDGVRRVLASARARGLSVGLRGAGQSYGDAALNAENVCLDLSRMTRILAWDPEAGVIRVEPGVTIGQLWRYVVEDGWWPEVVPGTMHVTLGGGAAMNVHGKNNWRAGPIGEHILELELLLPNGESRPLDRTRDPELFHAVIGGFGMLGCITSVTLQLKRVHSGLVTVEPLCVGNVAEMIALFDARMADADYLVGWVDGMAGGETLGRGLVHAARHLAPGEDPCPAETLRVVRQELPPTVFGVPRALAWRVMRLVSNDAGMRTVNAVRWRLGRRQAGRTYRQSHAAFAFLFDYIPDWKRAYGPGGMMQYQSFIPAAVAADVFREKIRLAQRRGLPAYLGILKRHRADAFLMSHGVDGYSLALEFPVTASNRARVWALAAELDRLVLDAGGRFYFAKDSTLAHDRLGAFLAEERVQRFLALKRTYDPDELLQTDLYRRVFRAS